MLAFIPSLVLLLAVPSLLNAASSQELQVGGGSTSREAALDSVTVVISEACATQGDSSDVSQAGKEISLAAGSPLVLTHKIKLVPWPGSSSAACGCEADLAALRQRLERLEREVSALREKCGGADGGCCTSKESKGAGCSIHSEDECPNHCSDQGRCEDGRCVCFPGYGGPDCSRTDCPGDCSHRGSCVSGQCVCDPTFTGPDCSQSRCPHDCSRRGSCVDGRCVCSSGFTGPSCADRACAGSCHSRGRCVDGRCVCDEGFTGADCSTRTCPNNCSGRGTCVGGQCVCSAGSTGPDCSTRTCPSNCSNRGRCVKGRCVCRRGFAGPDCSRCDEGKTGPDCDTVMAGVSQLSTRDISETSATLVWTPPAVQYDSYHITFTSQKESDQQVTALVDGGLSSFTQAGLAAGQQYTVIVSGEVGGRRGAQSSAHFMTLIPSPTNLQVVKTTTTSAVVQWEKPQGEIDQYRLTVAPRDGAGKDQVMSVPADRNSAHVLQLDAGRVYDIVLVAEKGRSRSEPVRAQVVPGPEPPSDIVFSEVTENSLTVSWTKPKSPVNGFRVTYSHSEDADPLSVSVDSQDSTLKLSQLSPGSSYEVSVVSLLGLDESDPIKEAVSTRESVQLPDPPTDLQAVNVTDAKALLLWRPALAAVDQYSIVYGSGAGSEVRISVSGNSAEQQLSGLEASTTYTVTVSSRQGGVEGPAASSSFTTASGPADEDAPRDLQANNVTPRAARLSWKPPSKLIGSYRMTYGTEGQEMKEVTVEASMTQHHLTRLRPGAKYTVQLQAERGGQLLPTTSTEFTTGRLRFPFPSDCSQELLNGIRRSGATEIFPRGKLVAPVTVYCDMETDGGGWTVFQRRKDGSVNFFRGWKDYVKGFGDLNGEFWLGLDNLHNLTAMSRMSLRVDLRDRNESAFATYATFAVAQKNYRLTVGGYSGTAGDSLSYHSNRIFSTRDRDPLQSITRCATSYRGGWWYRNCHEANLNGLYGVNVKHQGVIWTSWRGKEFSIPFTEMKMRPAAFRG
ncbi:tenascin isoform X3 [Betta splendens]|uniref:Tenascin isoform X3 n=1 Tax=Betta splendens TaxID=158456 RepID=A0A6P7P1K5_BETSP|nr:tenascin isoform X3 [Betta splendens]